MLTSVGSVKCFQLCFAPKNKTGVLKACCRVVQPAGRDVRHDEEVWRELGCLHPSLSPLRFGGEETFTPRECTEGTLPPLLSSLRSPCLLSSPFLPLPLPPLPPSCSSMVSSYLSCGCRPYRRTLAMPAWNSLLQLCPTSLPRRHPWASL